MKHKSNKNLLYIGILSVVIIIAIIIVLISKCSNDNGPVNKIPTIEDDTTAIAIQEEKGDQNTVIDKEPNIPSREIDFSKSIKQIKKYEKKREDTLPLDKNKGIIQSQDGFTYLMYPFNNVNAAKFFGVQIATSDDEAMITYVFNQDKLIEVRVQYGSIGSNSYDTVIENITKEYGQATYSRIFSNEAKEYWWKSKKITLKALYEDAKVVLYYRLND